MLLRFLKTDKKDGRGTTIVFMSLPADMKSIYPLLDLEKYFRELFLGPKPKILGTTFGTT